MGYTDMKYLYLIAVISGVVNIFLSTSNTDALVAWVCASLYALALFLKETDKK